MENFMTLVVIGPVTEDLIIIGEEKSRKVGGATYFQSFVFEEFYKDYLAVVNCSDESLIRDFPSKDKVKVVLKDDTHFFINRYPFEDNLDIREQISNFADIPILKSDLEDILPDEIDAFVINPLNRHDFPLETIDYLKSFNVPIFMSVQGFLRMPLDEVNENYTIKLEDFDEFCDILEGVTSIFLDEGELNIIGLDFDVDEIVVTDGSRGSRIIGDGEIKIDAVKCEDVVDTTGCGDTYMAAYITQKILLKNSKIAGDFASSIASRKIENSGPYNSN
ncbi:PfkB family carbohydrate kinase [uncultured Methanobrevibacter sp.]|uniref:PfkB family carbohydrate kinase n=1 Tax=uncultured Methanobrevibacter sp. TaxID=253161 RepID=UPI0025E37512|nr:PfkB family carbohydrate kinase [uncultured Methanobrevibacter sp.]